MENVWILLAIFVVLMMMHVPIAVAMGLSSLIGFMMIGYNLTTVGSLLYTAVASTSMITIPGYIFAGAIMAKGGISRHLLNALNAWIGHVPGGVAIATVLACAMFAAITGSASATIAAVGGLMIPAMIVVFYGAGSQCGIFGNPDPPKHPNDSLYDDSRSIGIKIVRCWHASRADRGRCVLNLYCYL